MCEIYKRAQCLQLHGATVPSVFHSVKVSDLPEAHDKEDDASDDRHGAMLLALELGCNNAEKDQTQRTANVQKAYHKAFNDKLVTGLRIKEHDLAVLWVRVVHGR
mgnify:CR=1 FL=1